jgi:hypothetical protein
MTTNDHAEILKGLEKFLATEDLRTLVLLELHTLHDDLRLVRPLIVTRQATLGFLSVEAAKVQDDLIRDERADRARHAREGIKVSGVVPAPGSINAFSLLAEWADLLADIERSTTARLQRAGVCHITSRPGMADSDADRYSRVVELVSVLSRDRYLRRVHADLVDLHARVTRCIDGNQVKAMPDPCPWCGLNTLVANLTTGVITCDRDPSTGEHETCICSDSYCLCRTKPREHRHTWQRDDKAHKASSWEGLRRAINHRPDPTEQDPS